jgi:hypothetical protein
VYCQNCFNEGHSMKECKLLMKLCARLMIIIWINVLVTMSGSCPSKEIVPVHVIQAKIPIVQEQKQLSNYSVPNDQNQYNN